MKLKQLKLSAYSGKASLIALAVLASPLAFADDSGWYAGASVGRSNASIDDARITRDLLARGFATTTTINDDDRETGFKVLGGYQLNSYLALEGGYFDLGTFGFRASTLPAGTLNGKVKLRGINLDLVASLPVTEKFSVLGRIGATRTDADGKFEGTGLVAVGNPNPNQRDNNLKIGLGLQYAFTDAFALRTEVERYRTSDSVGNKGDIDMVSLGVIYRFGAKEPARTAYVPPPQPAPAMVARQETVVAAPPPPPPPPPMTPAPIVPMKVTFSADSLFDFDKSNLRPAGRQDLDKFAADLKGTRFDLITVTGHSDRIGSHAYNMKLSTRRAEAVKAYLVDTAGLPASTIATKGVDGVDPVTKPGECKGTKKTPALIACLQPDRRVEVEVTGTR
jgi:OOP family OmpA-OmpF porin